MTLRLPASLLVLMICVSLAASQDAPPQRVRVSGDVMRGVLVKKVAPIYPPLARQAHIQGTVIPKILVNKSGDVYDVQLVSGHLMLSPAAIEAVKQWQYQPYLLNGEAVEVETSVQVVFRLAGEPPEPNGVAGDAPGGVGFPQATTSPKGRVRISENVARSLCLCGDIHPIYPPEAKAKHIEGVVVLKVDVTRDGNVNNLELISGHPLLAPAAIDAVKRWKYKPFLLNGAPVEVETTVQVNFVLEQP